MSRPDLFDDEPTNPAVEENKNVTKRSIVLNNVELFEDAILDFKKQIVSLVQNGVISETTAQKIILDHEYGFFQQMVQIEYK